MSDITVIAPLDGVQSVGSSLSAPSVTDLQAVLIGSGLLSDPATDAQGQIDLQQAMSAAFDEWDRLTRWHPFVSSDATSVRRFDLPDIYNSRLAPGGGHILDLRGGFVSLTSIVLDGTTLTRGTDYELLQVNARDGERFPYTHVEFLTCRRTGSRRAVYITAEWGFCNPDSCPSRAYRAILDLAQMIVTPSLQRLLTGGGADKVKQGPVEYSFGGSSSSGSSWTGASYLQSRIDSAVLLYRRQSLA